MQALVRDLQNQSISGLEPSENQENVHDSGTESDDEELQTLSDQEVVIKHRRKTSFSMVDPPTICSSPPPNDADSKDSFGKESGILSDSDGHSDSETPKVSEKDCLFPVMSMDSSNEPTTITAQNILRPRRCRVRVLVHRRQRQESESDMEIVLKNDNSSLSPVKRKPIKRPALDLDKMMKTRFTAVPPKRERISSCSSTLSID